MTANLTRLEKNVICMIYYELLTVSEAAYVLDIDAGIVRKLLWRITERFVS